MNRASYIGLLDCNNFFVSCERLFRPDLAGKPVVVLSANDGCIIARSQEAKQLGVVMGMPYFKVQDELTRLGVTVFSSNFSLYRDVSSRVMRALATCVDTYEVYSIDEAFFVLSGDTPHEEAARIRATVERWTGMPLSVGVGTSKTIAKYASERAKERSRQVGDVADDGVHTFVDMEAWRAEAAQVPVALLWGVGRATNARFARHGIMTALDVMNASRERLRATSGIMGARLYEELSGGSAYAVGQDAAAQQSIMSTRSFGRATTKRRVIDDAIAYHVSHATEKMRMRDAAASHLRVVLYPSRHGAYHLRGGTAEVTLSAPLCDTRLLIREAYALIDTLYDPAVPYAKAGIELGGFVPFAYAPQELFASETLANQRALMGAVDAINAAHGAGSIRPGTVAQTHEWAPRAANVSPHYTTSWEALPLVRAS